MAPSLGWSTGHRSSGGFPHLGAQHPHEGLLLFGNTVRDSHSDIHSHQGGKGRQRDAGIARAGFNQSGAVQLSPFDEARKQVGGRAVLHRPERIQPFQLEEQVQSRRGNPVEPHERRRVVRPREQVAHMSVATEVRVGW